MNQKTILKVKDLNAWYGSLHILKGVNMDIKQGDLVAIIGPNGSGKSTTLKSIAGTLRKKTGIISYNNKDISKKQPYNITEKGISFCAQGRRVFPTMTVQENLEMGGYLLAPKTLKSRLRQIYKFLPELKRWKNKRATFLSGGQQQLLSLGRALMLKPKILLLDEPSLGLSPIAMRDIFKKIVQINKQGTTIILVEQNARLALSICNKAYVLELGQNRLAGQGKKLLKDARLKKLYLGGS